VEEEERQHFYVTGSRFEGQGLFEREYIDRCVNLVRFGAFKPDLIEVKRYDEKDLSITEIRVIEVKASKNLNVHSCGFWVDQLGFSPNPSIPLLDRA